MGPGLVTWMVEDLGWYLEIPGAGTVEILLSSSKPGFASPTTCGLGHLLSPERCSPGLRKQRGFVSHADFFPLWESDAS